MHGQYRRLTEQPPVDMRETYGWLEAANLPAATEELVVAAQDQALRTRDYERKILHRDVSPTCRMYCRDVATGPVGPVSTEPLFNICTFANRRLPLTSGIRYS